MRTASVWEQASTPVVRRRDRRLFAFIRCPLSLLLPSLPRLPWFLVLVASAFAAEPPRIDHHDLTFYLDSDGRKQPIKTVADWERRRAAVLQGMQAVMGLLPGEDRRVPLDVQTISEETRDGILFRKLTYASEPAMRVPAWLLIPEQRANPAPAMLCLHQTTELGKDEPVGLGGSPNLHYALELAQRGYVTLAPDFPTLGEYEWTLSEHPEYAGGTMQAIWNHIRAVDLLASLPEVDAERMGVIGHSLGGHNAMFVGAFEPRLKVIVSSCGFTRFHKDDMPSWTGERYMPRIATVYSNDADRMPFDFAEIVGTFAPRAFFASAATGDDDFDVTGVEDVMESAAFVYQLYGAERKLGAVYPESPHDFPPAARRRAYAFVDEQLKEKESMSQRTRSDNENAGSIHRIVTEGTLSELHAALKAGADPNAPGRVGATPLMLAIDAHDLEKMKLLLTHGADPELTDDFNATALRRAIQVDFAEGARLLLSLGVDRGYQPKYPLKKVDYDFVLPETPMPAELREFMSEAEWKESSRETDRRMREMWQNPTIEPMISDVQSVAVLKLFLEAGDDLALAPAEIRRAFIGLETGGELQVTTAEYRRHKFPRYGRHNPERMDYPFWKDMIRTGGSACSARTTFEDDDPFSIPGVVWCFDRFGSSLTPLADGRFVQIGGEHEDFYDPDFFIYNDIVVHDGRGGSEIYGYPRDVFPPTDFHTATLCRDGIYIIGCLGYPEQRQPQLTPVYRLTLDTWQIQSIATAGDQPGWISRHRAQYVPGRNAIRVSGGESHSGSDDEPLAPQEGLFELELSQLRWRRID